MSLFIDGNKIHTNSDEPEVLSDSIKDMNDLTEAGEYNIPKYNSIRNVPNKVDASSKASAWVKVIRAFKNSQQGIIYIWIDYGSDNKGKTYIRVWNNGTGLFH